jgi:hypothetical protein
VLRTWQIDDANVVKADIGMFGTAVLTANGKLISKKFKTHKKAELGFELADGRKASLAARPQFVGGSELSLRVNGQLMVENGKRPIHCSGCDAVVNPNDRFCAACGVATPSAESHVHRRNLAKATQTMSWLSVLFALSGLLFFFIGQKTTAAALVQLNGLDPQATYPSPIDGVTYTVGALRERILWNHWGALIIGLLLAAVMGGLAAWGRRAPLPAVLIATATYCVLVVANAIVDPATLAQGILLKIVVVAFLFRGIKAALALNSKHA